MARGCVNVIEFDGLKLEAGARWPRICEGVYARLEVLLRTKLDPNDVFLRIGETAYLVTMPTTDPEDVSAICTRVSFDLHTSFLGQCGLGQLHVNTVSCDDQDMLVLNRLPIDRMIALADKVGILDMLGAQGTAVGAGFQTTETTQTGLTETAASPVAITAFAAAPATAPITIKYHYIPFWSVPNRAITGYACEPKLIFVSPHVQPVSISQLDAKERIQVEVSALQTGIEKLSETLSTGNRFLMTAPISFDVFGAPTARMAILSTFKALPCDFRQYIAFIIYGVPPGVAQTRLANMVNALQSVCRSVSATIAPKSRVYASYQGIGLKAIGFDLREFTNQNRFRQHDAEQLAQFARQSNLGTFFAGVQSKTTLKYAQDANIQLLSGPAIAPPCSEPEGMRRLTWAETLSSPDLELWV